jgi:N utilization substance protein B
VHAAQIDGLLAQYAEGWTLERMPAVDRNVLRIGVFELLWAPDVPDGVAISEAVLLVQDLSTDSSPQFVNGLLAKIAEVKPSIADLTGHPAGETPLPPPAPEASVGAQAGPTGGG